MKVRFVVEEPDATIKITMSIKEWRDLKNQLDSKWPSYRLGIAINQVLDAAQNVYCAKDQEISVGFTK